MSALSSAVAVSADQQAWVASPTPAESVAHDSRAGVVRDLRERMRELQPSLFPARELPTHAAVSVLLGGALRAGGVYALSGSYSVALSALAAASAAGQWVAVVGLPHVGIEAAAELGVDVDRMVVIPDASADWLSVLVALIDTVAVVLVCAPRGVDEGTAARLASRLRQRESALIVVGQWPHVDARLAVSARRWTGIGAGWGRLAECGMEVTAWDKVGRTSERTCVLSAAGISAAGAGQAADVDVASSSTAHRHGGPRLTVVGGQRWRG